MSDEIILWKNQLQELWLHPQIEEVAKITGGRLLGIGRARCAVEDGKWVAKIAWRESGQWDNYAEAALWQTAPPDLREMLAPSCYMQEGVLWQERCWPIAANRENRTIRQELSRWGITDVSSNLGVLKNKIVCYDYAFLAPWVFEKIANQIAKNEQKQTFSIK